MATVLIRAHERDALPFVESGILRVDPDGTIWRCKVRQFSHGSTWWIDRAPTRAEHDTGHSLDLRLSIGNFQRIVVPAGRLVWIVLNGPIPEGKKIYRRDKDYRNNDPDNLRLSLDRKIAIRKRQPFRTLLSDESSIERLRHACDHPSEFRIVATVAKYRSIYRAAQELGCPNGSIYYLMKKLMARLNPGEHARVG